MTRIDAAAFRQTLGHFASGVTVLTGRSATLGDLGMTASAFCSVSLDPPLVLVCVSRQATLHDVLMQAPGFAINVLAADQAALSDRFAGGIRDARGRWRPWPDGRDRFSDLATERGPFSEAFLLQRALFCLDCARHDSADGGDHTIFIGRVMHIRAPADGADRSPLLYHTGRYAALAED